MGIPYLSIGHREDQVGINNQKQSKLKKSKKVVTNPAFKKNA